MFQGLVFLSLLFLLSFFFIIDRICLMVLACALIEWEVWMFCLWVPGESKFLDQELSLSMMSSYLVFESIDYMRYQLKSAEGRSYWVEDSSDLFLWSCSLELHLDLEPSLCLLCHPFQNHFSMSIDQGEEKGNFSSPGPFSLRSLFLHLF